MKATEADTKTKWGFDAAHNEVGFKMKHLMIANVRANYKEFDGSIYTTGEDFITSEGETRKPSSRSTEKLTEKTGD